MKTRWIHISEVGILLLLAGVVLSLSRPAQGGSGDRTVPGKSGFTGLLKNGLSLSRSIPEGESAISAKPRTMIYILGSTQGSLGYHFRTAAMLFERGIADRVFILSRPGITEFSPEFQRNLTNDEWSLRMLEGLGVSRNHVETIPVPSRMFGTLIEGRIVAQLANKRGYERIVLVSSSHHTRRVFLTFSHFLLGGEEIFLYGSDDPVGLTGLVVEYGKYVLYRCILIPLSGWVDI